MHHVHPWVKSPGWRKSPTHCSEIQLQQVFIRPLRGVRAEGQTNNEAWFPARMIGHVQWSRQGRHTVMGAGGHMEEAPGGWAAENQQVVDGIPHVVAGHWRQKSGFCFLFVAGSRIERALANQNVSGSKEKKHTRVVTSS